MPKHASQAEYEPAQPLLRGINLARFLCEKCPFYRLTEGRDGKSRNGSGLPPVFETTTSCAEEELADHKMLGLPGPL